MLVILDKNVTIFVFNFINILFFLTLNYWTINLCSIPFHATFCFILSLCYVIILFDWKFGFKQMNKKFLIFVFFQSLATVMLCTITNCNMGWQFYFLLWMQSLFPLSSYNRHINFKFYSLPSLLTNDLERDTEIIYKGWLLIAAKYKV